MPKKYKQTYEEFIKKFTDKPKTTDDCYTPFEVMKTVREYCINKYNINEDNIVQPFYPGGDYTAEDYTDKIVVDNPPFSILAKIVRWFNEHGVRYFLFAPALTCLQLEAPGAILLNATITYNNGARVSTSFLTNLENGIMSDPELFAALEEVDRMKEDHSQKRIRHHDNILLASEVGAFSKYGIAFRLEPYEYFKVKKEGDDAIYGYALLISNAKKQQLAAEKERRAAEKERRALANAEPRELSPEQYALIKVLDEVNS